MSIDVSTLSVPLEGPYGLVFTPKNGTSQQQAKAVTDTLKRTFPGVPIVLLPPGYGKLDVVDLRRLREWLDKEIKKRGG